MNINRYIQRWTEKGLVTHDQAKDLLADVKQVKKSETQSNFIIALSTIGAVLFGVGAVLFISSNWEYMGDLVKVLLLSTTTGIILLLGYYLKYEKENYTRFGGSLIFLSTILIGATVFLTAQIYNVAVESSILLLIWGLLILPVVYLEKNTSLAILFMGITYFWLYYFLDETFLSSAGEFSIILFFLFALLWFEIGTLHNLKKDVLGKISRIYRLTSIQMSLIILFIMSFNDFLRVPTYSYNNYYAEALRQLIQFRMIFMIGALIAIILMAINYLRGLIKNRDEMSERVFALTSIFTILAYLSFTTYYTFFAISFNFILFGVAICLLYFGYKREDPKLVNMGAFWLGLLILARYFDLFYEMLPTSLFFLFGGIILLAGGFVLERSRRELLSQIKGE